jgi:hypothetical protein
VASGTIEWPFTLDSKGVPQWQAEAPRGVEHHYAPLSWGLENGQLNDRDCLCTIEPINSCSVAARQGDSAPAPPVRPAPTPGSTPRRPNP